MDGTAQEEIETLEHKIQILKDNKNELMHHIRTLLFTLSLFNVYALPEEFRNALAAFMDKYHIDLSTQEEIDQEIDEEQTANNNLEHIEQEMQGTATQQVHSLDIEQGVLIKQDNSTQFLDLPDSEKQMLENELAEATEELKIISMIYEKLEENLQTIKYNVGIIDLEVRITDLEDEIIELHDGITELQDEITECHTTIAEQDVTIVGLKTKEIVSTVRVENLYQQIAANETALASLKEKLKQSKMNQESLVKKQNQDFLESKDHLRQELSEKYSTEIHNKSEEITALQHQIETQTKIITHLKGENDLLSQQNSKHARTIKNLRDEKKKLTTKINAELLIKQQCIQQENIRLKAELEATKEEQARLAETNATLVTKATKFIAKESTSSEEYRAAIDNIASLETQKIALTTTLKEKAVVIETQITQNKFLRGQLEAANAKLVEEDNAIHYLSKENISLKEQLCSLNEINFDLQRYIARLTSEKQQQKSDANKVRDQFNFLYAEIQNIQNKINTLNGGIPILGEWLSQDMVKTNEAINSFKDLLSNIVSKQDSLTTLEENSGDKYNEIISQIENLKTILSMNLPQYLDLLSNIQQETQSLVKALLGYIKPIPQILGNPASVQGTLFQHKDSSTRLNPNTGPNVKTQPTQFKRPSSA